MTGTNVRDRNGREIKLGDRVRISAEETNKFLIYEFGGEFAFKNNLISNIDDFGTVVFEDGFFQIVNENGDMLIDLSSWEGEQDDLFEVVTSERGFHKAVVNGEELLVANTLADAFISWFGEESGKSFMECFSNAKPSAKCVYVLHMDNDTVKIGVTQNFNQRQATISTSSGLNILEWCHTESLPKRKAYSIESALHKTFSKHKTKGEFFAVDYSEACNALEKHAKIFAHS